MFSASSGQSLSSVAWPTHYRHPGPIMWLTSLHPSLGNGPAGCGGVGPSHGPCGSVVWEPSPLAAREGFLYALTTSSTGASTLKSFRELCRNLLSGFHWKCLFLQFPLKYSCTYRYIIVHEMHFGMLPRLEYLSVSNWLLAAGNYSDRINWQSYLSP